MARLLLIPLLVFVLLSSSGCISLSRTEKTTLRELKTYGIAETDVKAKNPGAAGALNILPGFGNFYLAIGTDESEQWIVGFMNLLFWPISIVWGIPEAAIDANTLNSRETVYYYTFDREGRTELAKLKADLAQPVETRSNRPISPTDFVLK
ncbi:hypothetical protein LLG95_15095 [bacterium]|nr:hypothetical protein [bacterium]